MPPVHKKVLTPAVIFCIMNILLSIIIPTFNEEENIGKLISFLKNNDPGKVTEIIVCDGQSNDKTVEVASIAGAKVLIAPTKGRSAQMNYGASYATAGILYFVHSDCFPPATFKDDIQKAINDGYELGRYKTKFDSSKLLLKINTWFTRFDWFIGYGGDQTLFITKKLFDKIAGFNRDMRIMEDYDLVIRARQFSKYKIFKNWALVSARKYDTNSWVKVQLANWKIIRMFKKGASQNEMVAKYKALLNYR